MLKNHTTAVLALAGCRLVGSAFAIALLVAMLLLAIGAAADATAPPPPPPEARMPSASSRTE